jgi:hypothetical protein
MIFDDTLREVDFELLKNGKIKGGGGTDFDMAVRDFLEDELLHAGILFTDGEGGINKDIGFRLKKSRKKLYVIYILDERYRTENYSLSPYVTDSVTIIRKNQNSYF